MLCMIATAEAAVAMLAMKKARVGRSATWKRAMITAHKRSTSVRTAS